MNTRIYNQTIANQLTNNFNSLQSSGIGQGNVFVGGAGKVSIANQTEGFICAGNSNTQLFAVNRGNKAYIRGGDFGNEILSVGHNSTIYGGKDVDKVFSIGANCDISLKEGADQICTSGAGTIVDGGAGNDYGSGTLGGLTYNALFSLDVISMLTKIRSASINYFTKTN